MMYVDEMTVEMTSVDEMNVGMMPLDKMTLKNDVCRQND